MDVTPAILSRIAAESANAKIVADAQFRVVWVNRAFEETTGYRLAEIAGKRPGEFLQGAHTDRQTVESIRERLRTRQPVDAELLNYRRNGEPFWVSLRIRPLVADDGRLIGYHSTQLDITARRTAEQALAEAHAKAQSVLDTVQSAIVSLDADGQVTLLNRAGRELLGLREGEVTGTEWFTRFVPRWPDGRPALEAYRAVFRGDGPDVADIETELVTLAGERRTVRWHIAWIRDGDGKRTGLLKSGNDITERRALQQQANRRVRLEAIGTLAGGIAHDLNNALTPITMGLEALGAESPEQAQLIAMLEMSAIRASALVRQLLNFAKGAEGEQLLVSPTALLQEVETLVRRTFPKSIRTEVTAPSVTAFVRGDATQLQQVLLNLCVNARDAMEHGGTLRLQLDTVTVDPATLRGAVGSVAAGRYVRFVVEDDGSGIAPEALERIFEPFFTTKGPDRGTGLGLSNVLGIVRGHHGFITVQSAPGQGSAFAVHVPVAPAEAPDEQAAASTDFRGDGRQVLYVDDEPAIRVLAAMLLERMGCRTALADSVESAERWLATPGHRADVVVTDMHMPGEQGASLVARIRARWPLLPIIVATGLADDRVHDATRVHRNVHVLHKPYTERDLAMALERALAADGRSGATS